MHLIDTTASLFDSRFFQFSRQMATMEEELERVDYLQTWEEKIEAYAHILDKLTKSYHVMHLVCAPVYAKYGNALLRKTQEQSDALGQKVDGMAKEKAMKQIEDHGSDDTPAEHGELDSTKGITPPPQTDEALGDDDPEEGEPEDEDQEQEADDLELAFQVLEMARKIFEEEDRHGEHEMTHGEVRELLGEIALENEQWVDAAAEFEKALELKMRHLPNGDRQLAQLHCQVASANAALQEKSRLEAVKHYDAAAEVLRARISGLSARASSEAANVSSSEITELRELLAELVERSQEHSQRSAASSNAPLASEETTEGTTTIGFGNGGATSIGFGNATDAAPPMPISISVRKKTALEPCNPNSGTQPCAESKGAMKEGGVAPTVKKIRLQ